MSILTLPRRRVFGDRDALERGLRGLGRCALGLLQRHDLDRVAVGRLHVDLAVDVVDLDVSRWRQLIGRAIRRSLLTGNRR